MNKLFILLLPIFLFGCNDNGFPTDPTHGNLPPEIKSISIQGDTLSEAIIKVQYEYVDNENDPEGYSKINWTIDGKDTGISTINFPIPLENKGIEVTACVIPIAKSGTLKGNEACSQPKLLSHNTAPIINDLIINSNYPMPGNTVTAEFSFFDSDGDIEGDDEILWLSDGNQIHGETSKYLTLTNNESETLLTLCVTPIAQTGILKGNQKCTSLPVHDLNTPPEIKNVQIHSYLPDSIDPDEHIELSELHPHLKALITGEYVDAESDPASIHTFRWEMNGKSIIGEDKAYYEIKEVDANKIITGCITPYAKTGIKQGIEICTETPIGKILMLVDGPQAVVKITGVPYTGNTISAEYSYDANGGSADKYSQFGWALEKDGITTYKKCSIGAHSPCTITVEEDMLGGKLESCVLPINGKYMPGTPNCTHVYGTGITLSGTLELRKSLHATLFGFDKLSTPGNTVWKMDIDAPNGPSSDLNRTVITNNTLDLRIGNIDTILANPEYKDSNNNNILDDRDIESTPTISYISSANYIGKDVEFCVSGAQDNLGNNYPELCVTASVTQGLNNKVCINNSLCVTGGIYFGTTIVERGIEPVAEIKLINSNDGSHNVPITNPVIFHRPLTIQEFELANEIGLGDITPIASGVFINQMGLDWALQQHSNPGSNSEPIDYCLHLKSKTGQTNWSLPVASNQYRTDSHSSDGNMALTGDYQNMENLGFSLFYMTNFSSPTWGWPFQTGSDMTNYNTATLRETDKHYYANLRQEIYSSFARTDRPRFTTCITPQY